MSSDAQKRAYKKYAEKTINFAFKYSAVDAIEGRRLKAYLATIGQSANSYIKALIKSDLDAKDVPYPDNKDNTEDI